MSKIFVLCGKSGCGKDTMFQKLLATGNFLPIISTTSRPIRENEKQGREYHFITKEEFLKRADEGKFLEYRAYNTDVGGVTDTWYYGSEIIDLDACDKDYIVILDIEGAQSYITKYGKDNCYVIELNVDDNVREARAKARGSFDKTEWDRRLTDDAVKFSAEAKAGVVDVCFNNAYDPDDTFDSILHWINKRRNVTPAKPDTMQTILDLILSDNKFRDTVKDTLQDAIASSIKRSFDYGDLHQAVEKRCKEILVPWIENYDMGEFIPKLDAVMTGVANTKLMSSYASIINNFERIAGEPVQKLNGTRISDIFKKYCDYVKDEVANDINTTSDRDRNEDGEYEPVCCSMTIHNSSYSPDYERYDISFSTPYEDDTRDITITLRETYHHAGKSVEFNVDGIDGDLTIRNLRYLDAFKVYLLQIEMYGTVVLDGKNDKEEYIDIPET